MSDSTCVAGQGGEHPGLHHKESVTRFIPASAAQIEQMKKQAKRLQRNGGGKHADLLKRVAKAAGYDHWHHARQCFEQASMPNAATLIAECEAIVTAELQGVVKAVMTGPESPEIEPLVLFSTGLGDAWLLDPDENLALCLLWHGVKQSIDIKDDPRGFQIAWDGDFFLSGSKFEVQTEHPEIGERFICRVPARTRPRGARQGSVDRAPHGRHLHAA